MTDSRATVDRADALAGPVGSLRLHVANRGDRAIATDQYFQGALRVLRPHYLDESGQVTYTIVNPGGGYLGGDVYDIDVEVAQDASLLLTTQSATKVYRTPEAAAHQRTVFRLGPRAVLENLPDQLIAYREAHYVQDTVVDMDASATFVTAEIITPGWAPDGTLFTYDEVRLRQEVRIDEVPVVLDSLIVRPDAGDESVESTLFMAGRTHLGTLLAVDGRIDDALVAEVRALVDTALQERTGPSTAGRGHVTPVAGVSAVPGPGLAVRVLGTSTEHVQSALMAVVDLLRARWRAQDPVHLRKY
ncbi:urease accessory protein UreD [Brevibacterium yomogidense]|uniref:Urease accessory protein UreD n=1 Tax=Brevibacterium yomogidense TaxID=946573 RepID=A0A1X6WUP0_9MICO|nr:urease accessory protein UreD [Brevibacterium yomogidense]SLM89065.1 Urease accessory protein UreD [Brevibacterium yomogidense]